jgi:hypothetical protein
MTPAEMRERVEGMAQRAREEEVCRCERDPAWCFVHRRWGRAMSTPPTRHELVEQVRGLTATVVAQADEITVLRRTLALSQESLAAAVRGERVTVVDEVARLTREVATVTRERDEAREIITGRKVPPTRAEIEVHALWNRRWLLRVDHEGRRLVYTLDAGREDALAEARAGARDGVRWWALECDGRPCAWPVVEVPHG